MVRYPAPPISLKQALYALREAARAGKAAPGLLICSRRCRLFAPRWTPRVLPAQLAGRRLRSSAAVCS
jgi:hypothetical protein